MSCQSICQLKLNYEANTINIENESPERIAIREVVQRQFTNKFGQNPADDHLNLIVDGFILFNLRKDKYMLKSKDELLQYCKDKNVTIQEKMYFEDIFLFNQRPDFLSDDEHEYIRAMGDLDDYTPPPPRRPSGFTKPILISDELAEFLGKTVGTKMAKTVVSKEINAYIKNHHLKDRKNGNIINPDEKLRKLLNIKNCEEVNDFNLYKYMKHHFIEPVV